MLKLFGLESEPSLRATGADCAWRRQPHAPISRLKQRGLHAVSLGLSQLAGDDDHGLLHNAVS